MSNIAVRVENLGKQYFIGQGKQAAYETLSERLNGIITAPLHSIRSVLRGQSSAVATESIWALKDVSFEVRRGEVVGIIGRNGAGKSTLLKILSQITEPTEGVVDIYGRVGALLEVGTGFHPELTGRENVYLNGAILGMKRAEIQRNFDEIVAFSGVEKFIDTPVKYYSSGMTVRLAFAVAAHLEPEILIVDEVLAVGDAEFQKKCLGKMGDVTREGRTVLFVSHNMGAVQNLCQQTILLQDGSLAAFADTRAVIDRYLKDAQQQEVNVDILPEHHWKYPPALEVFRVELRNQQNEITTTLLMNELFSLNISYRIHNPDKDYRIGVIFRGNDGVDICSTVNTDYGLPHIEGRHEGISCISVHVKNILLPGKYTLDITVKTLHNEWIDHIKGISFFVEALSIEATPIYRQGLVHIDAEWLIR